jgi:hypothetical protein
MHSKGLKIHLILVYAELENKCAVSGVIMTVSGCYYGVFPFKLIKCSF